MHGKFLLQMKTPESFLFQAYCHCLETQILSGFGMRGWWNEQTLGRQKEVMAKMLQWLADGLISIPAGKGYPLEQAAEAVLLTTRSGRGPKPILLLG